MSYASGLLSIMRKVHYPSNGSPESSRHGIRDQRRGSACSWIPTTSRRILDCGIYVSDDFYPLMHFLTSPKELDLFFELDLDPFRLCKIHNANKINCYVSGVGIVFFYPSGHFRLGIEMASK